jgi:hypothetical protein
MILPFVLTSLSIFLVWTIFFGKDLWNGQMSLRALLTLLLMLSAAFGQLYQKLVRATQVRAVITLASAPVAILAWTLIPGIQNQVTVLVALFGVPLFVGWLTTMLLCRRMVRCPVCSQSLWEVGTGNFKARRVRIKDNVTCCPHCGAEIV